MYLRPKWYVNATFGPVSVAVSFYSLSSLCISKITTYIYHITLISIKKKRIHERKMYLLHKRRVLHCLGPFPLPAPSTLSLCRVIFTTYIYSRTLISIKKDMNKFYKDVPRAQTTQDASFGPVNVASTFYSLLSSCISYITTYIYNRTLISNE